MAEMTGQQALQTMDQVGAVFQGTRAQHVAIQAAMATLAKIIARHDAMTAPENVARDAKIEEVPQPSPKQS
jgi:DNA-binding transcriptional regulator of glucitol operon